MRNSEDYYDPTAGIAVKNIERNEKAMQEIRRGDIFYVEKFAVTGSEQQSGRPALVVSNDKGNRFSEVVEVVYLSTAPKNDLPTHVTIRSTSRESIAVCEQITSVSKERFQSFIAAASTTEMTQIDTALLISLDLTMGAPEAPATPQKAPETIVSPEPAVKYPASFEVAYRQEKAEKERLVSTLKKSLIKAEAELEIYKTLYADMTERAMRRAVNA